MYISWTFLFVSGIAYLLIDAIASTRSDRAAEHIRQINLKAAAKRGRWVKFAKDDDDLEIH